MNFKGNRAGVLGHGVHRSIKRSHVKVITMLIIVGSSNPVKINATKNVFEKFYTCLKIRGVEFKTSTPPQPIGLKQTISGAIERAKMAKESFPRADFTVGIEAGLIPMPYTLTGYVDQQFAAILDKDGRITIGGGPVFEHPPKILRRVLKGGLEIGVAMEELTGIEGIGEMHGAIGYLSHGFLNRTHLTEQAVFMALIPRINFNLYLGESD